MNNIRDQLNATAPATLTAQGDIVIASGANALARLAKSTTSTQYLANTGTSNAPAWDEVALATGVSGTLPVGNGGTGATTLTANGALIGNGTSAITSVDMSTKGGLLAGDGSGNPSVLAVGGTNDHVLTVDSGEATGMKWASVGGAGDFQRFTSSGTWTRPSGTTVIMEVIGAGGGGGGGADVGRGAGGGGGGSLVRGVYEASALASSLTVTIGAAGTAGAEQTNGGTGGTTSVTGSGFTLSAAGGGGGGAGGTGSNHGGGGGGAGINSAG